MTNALSHLFRDTYEVEVANGGAQALERLRARSFHALISDQRMPEMTGVELLRQAKGIAPGTIRLLLTGYSDLADGDLERVGSVLHAAAARLGTDLVPLPTSSHPGELDIMSIRRALGTDTETSFPASPQEAAAAVGRCRVVVTGSYHAAVFALAQGIPAVCLAKSAYYDWKHRGLAHLFGRGCDVVHLRSGALEDELAARVEAAWSSAEEVREPLLAAARRQIEAGREAYDRLPGLLSR
mgnify:CR=1 FL=1